MAAAAGLAREDPHDAGGMGGVGDGARALLVSRAREAVPQGLEGLEELPLHAPEPLQPPLGLLEVSGQNLLEAERELGGGVAAGPDLEDGPDLAEREAELPEVADEAKPLEVVLGVPPVAPFAHHRGLQESLFLVEADRSHRVASGPGEIAGGEVGTHSRAHLTARSDEVNADAGAGAPQILFKVALTGTGSADYGPHDSGTIGPVETTFGSMRTLVAVGGKDGAAGQIELYAEAPLPTHRGTFRSIVFRDRRSGAEHVALVLGDLSAGVPAVRVHSECLTGEVLGSLKCDCRAQLDRALDHIAAQGQGALLYLRQEGRGIGLGNKIRAYALQAKGYDTYQANRALGFPDDLRRYDLAAEMLRLLGVEAVDLITNNPQKVAGLEEAGVRIRRRIPLPSPTNPHNVNYLRVKRDRTGHLILTDEDVARAG